MGKLFLAVLCASTLASGGTNVANPTITISPKPPSVGDSVKLTYTGKPGTVMNLDWHPTGTPPSVTVDANGDATFVVPAGATSLIVSDASGAASPISTTIGP